MSTKRVVLAEYFTTEELTLLFLVREDFDEPEVCEIPNSSLKEIQQFVTEHFHEERDDDEGQLIRSTGDKVRELDEPAYQDFFAPFIAPLVGDSHKTDDKMTNKDDIIWLVPHDVLHYLPLHALKVEGQYLIERNPVCYTPSASVMKYCQAKRKGRREKALVLGDSRNDLLHAREEALTVAKLFETTAYLNDQATKRLVKEKLTQERAEIDIFHLACHGYFDPYQALKSGIKLAPESSGNGTTGDVESETLTAEEIFGLEMQADLVTLSACETGVNERRPGDELIGLTRALIYAGTPSVVVSLWRVGSLSTQILMEQFYTALKNGEIKAAALQQAQMTLMRLTYTQVRDYVEARREGLAASQPAEAETLSRYLDSALFALEVDQPAEAEDETWLPFTKPYHWAPFVLVGDWK